MVLYDSDVFINIEKRQFSGAVLTSSSHSTRDREINLAIVDCTFNNIAAKQCRNNEYFSKCDQFGQLWN